MRPRRRPGTGQPRGGVSGSSWEGNARQRAHQEQNPGVHPPLASASGPRGHQWAFYPSCTWSLFPGCPPQHLEQVNPSGPRTGASIRACPGPCSGKTCSLQKKRVPISAHCWGRRQHTRLCRSASLACKSWKALGSWVPGALCMQGRKSGLGNSLSQGRGT